MNEQERHLKKINKRIDFLEKEIPKLHKRIEKQEKLIIKFE